MDKYVADILSRPEESLPDIADLDWFVDLSHEADRSFERGTVEGSFSAVLIYTQLTEEMLRILVSFSRLLLKAGIYPEAIHFADNRKMTLGGLVYELENSIAFHRKDRMILLCRRLNAARNEVMRRIMAREKAAGIRKGVSEIRGLFRRIDGSFDAAYDQYLKILFRTRRRLVRMKLIKPRKR
jgi:hypothetical protein